VRSACAFFIALPLDKVILTLVTNPLIAGMLGDVDVTEMWKETPVAAETAKADKMCTSTPALAAKCRVESEDALPGYNSCVSKAVDANEALASNLLVKTIFVQQLKDVEKNTLTQMVGYCEAAAPAATPTTTTTTTMPTAPSATPTPLRSSQTATGGNAAPAPPQTASATLHQLSPHLLVATMMGMLTCNFLP